MKIPDFSIRNNYARLIFGYFFVLVLYRIYSTQYLSFIYNQPIKAPELDYTYWLAHCLYFPHYIITHLWACYLIDIGCLFFLLGCIFSEKYRHWFARFFILFFFIQRFTLESYSVSHTKSISCLFFAFLPFCFKEDEIFELLVGFGRYFLIFILVSAAYHKFANGGLLTAGNFSHQLVNQHSDLAILNPTHISYRIASYLITHPLFGDIMFKLLWVSQVLFIVGIFTKRYDRFLWIILMGFAINTYFIMRIYNFDITVLGWTLWYFKPSRN